jgi:hypothetical protein
MIHRKGYSGWPALLNFSVKPPAGVGSATFSFFVVLTADPLKVAIEVPLFRDGFRLSPVAGRFSMLLSALVELP